MKLLETLLVIIGSPRDNAYKYDYWLLKDRLVQIFQGHYVEHSIVKFIPEHFMAFLGRTFLIGLHNSGCELILELGYL